MPTSNPYLNEPYDALYGTAQKRAGELMKPSGPRTPEQRAALALDTAHLLLVMAMKISRSEYSAGSPQKDVAFGASLADVFTRDYHRQVRELRWRVLNEAVDTALGKQRSLSANELIKSLTDKTTESDEGLFEALAELEAFRERK
uniref:Uncharacterized protein n=1 Tax=Mycena chlorophos TaxID=658473 RepID=A0ABQ0L0A7_MYCCL|nr:predicted protein [Mycena chlorophos]